MDLRQLLESRAARALDEAADRLLVASDLTGTFQLYELDDDALAPLTDFSEPVTGRYVPGSRQVVVQMDAGGDERYQLYLLDLDRCPVADPGAMVPLTSERGYVHHLLGVHPDGHQIAFCSNRRNGVDFDVYLLSLQDGETTLVYDGGGWPQEATGYSPSGRYLSFLLPGARPLDADLCLLDLPGGELLRPLSHPEEAARVGGPAFVGEHRFVASSDVGRDLAALVACDLETGEQRTLLEGDYELDCIGSRDGSTLLVVANEEGACRAELYSVVVDGSEVALAHPEEVPLPGRGVISFSLVTPAPLVAPDGSHVTWTFSSPLVPGDVWRYDRSSGAARRLTTSPGPDAESDGLVEPSTESVTSFDGEAVPLFCYRPAGHDGPPPVVLVIHGGPESQSVLSFNPLVQGFLAAGLAVVVPNVRGSTGYGKRYAGLDDTRRRLDSVGDLAAIHGWLEGAGLDPGRAALYGGSYGGYMVLAGVAFQPGLWAAGVDVVGISNLVTFLENTSDYRRAHREREYGSLSEDRDSLEQASPLRRVEDIVAPLFVIHGENDPRVPVSEARQLVASLERRGVDCELLVYPDEGHGLAKLKNRLEAYPRALRFLEGHLTGPGTPA